MPLDTMASAISRTVLSSILSANLFQLFQPMGGVRARSAARHADAEISAKTKSRFMSAIECIACEAARVGSRDFQATRKARRPCARTTEIRKIGKRFMKRICVLVLITASVPPGGTRAADAKKRLLAIGEEKGYRHESISHALATIERLGRETGLWDTTIRTDTEALTKKKLEYNAKNLNDFDAVLFYTGGTLEMDDQQKADFLSCIHDDGKGFIGIHSATITFTGWPEYGEMIGGYYDEHPWLTFDAPILVEAPDFPGMQQFPRSFVLRDEIYQM